MQSMATAIKSKPWILPVVLTSFIITFPRLSPFQEQVLREKRQGHRAWCGMGKVNPSQPLPSLNRLIVEMSR